MDWVNKETLCSQVLPTEWVEVREMLKHEYQNIYTCDYEDSN